MALKLNVEIPLLLMFFAMNFSMTINSNYIIYATCYVTLGHNETLCALLGTSHTNNETAELEMETQPFATRITTTSSVIDAIFAPLLCFFLGSWSDRFGRKPLMLISITGCIGSYLIRSIISAIPNVSPWFMLLSSIPSGISGGLPAFIIGVLCYITDTTTGQRRGIKMYIFEGIFGLSSVISALTSATTLRYLGYPAVFLVSCLCGVLSWIYVFFCIPESVQEVQKENKLKSLFNFSLLVITLKTVIKPRDHYVRAILLTAFVLMAFTVFSYFGLSSITFLYLRERFSWALQQYLNYSSIMSVVGIAGGTFAIIVFYKLLQFKEVFIILISLLLCLASATFQGMAKNSLQFYIAGSLSLFASTTAPMVRSLLSKIIEVDDIGKIFSILISIESLFGLSGTLFYTFIYDSTLTTLPFAIYLMASGIYVIDIILVLFIVVFQRYSNQLVHTEIPEELVT